MHESVDEFHYVFVCPFQKGNSSTPLQSTHVNFFVFRYRTAEEISTLLKDNNVMYSVLLCIIIMTCKCVVLSYRILGFVYIYLSTHVYRSQLA